VGTNPEARWCGNLRQDRFIWGSSHFGFGMNADVGGTIDSSIHYDVAWTSPTLTIDGKVVVKDGVIVGEPFVRNAPRKEGAGA
jgi:leucyl aminopeptidase (aminopeptidase T)